MALLSDAHHTGAARGRAVRSAHRRLLESGRRVVLHRTDRVIPRPHVNMPTPTPRRLTIATRQSALAMWQSEQVRTRLMASHRHLSIELLGLSTRGDEVLDRSLADIGGKGLFIKELEYAMADGRADAAVHSLKDLPMDMPDGFVLAAVVARDDPRDALVANRHASLAELPAGAVVGTSSLRREAQLRARFPALDIRPLRGNVNTRVAKLDAGKYDAIILAAAGLKRLGMGERIRELIDPADSLPAAGQGAMAVECCADRDDVVALCTPLVDHATLYATIAERAFARALSGNCHTPVGAYAEWLGDTLWLRGLIASADGREVMRGAREAVVVDAAGAQALGEMLGGEFVARGAARLASA
jgi:hydroxymethylbilane synthase